MTWYYNQRTGQLRAPDGQVYAQRGYSGAPGFVNNPDTEHLPFQGPIPRGRYTIRSIRDRSSTGPISIELSPDGHDAHGRTDLYAHGESRRRPPRESSQGCPILPRRQREAIRDSDDTVFEVVDNRNGKH